MTIPQPSLRHQDLIITLFAKYARPPQESIRIANLVQLMGDLGYDAPGVRSAISRLKSKGILVATKLADQAAYSLDPSMAETIADGDVRIFADTRPDSEDRWVLATFTVPESRRSLRHQIRSSLSRLGFGNAGQGLWIAPAVNLHDAEVALRRKGLNDYVEFFVGDYVAENQLAERIGQWWDIAELNSRFDPFISTYDGTIDDWQASGGAAVVVDSPAGDVDSAAVERDAFRIYVPMLTMWRELPYVVPPLPPEHLPENWNEHRARSLFYTAHEVLSECAQRHVTRTLTQQ